MLCVPSYAPLDGLNEVAKLAGAIRFQMDVEIATFWAFS